MATPIESAPPEVLGLERANRDGGGYGGCAGQAILHRSYLLPPGMLPVEES